MKKLLSTPKPTAKPNCDYTQVAGMKKLLSTPKSIVEPNSDYTQVAGVKKLMSTPQSRNPGPLADYTNVAGLKKLLKTPGSGTPVNSPEADYRNVRGLKDLMRTPKAQKLATEIDLEGVNELSKTPLANQTNVIHVYDMLQETTNTLISPTKEKSFDLVNDAYENIPPTDKTSIEVVPTKRGRGRKSAVQKEKLVETTPTRQGRVRKVISGEPIENVEIVEEHVEANKENVKSVEDESDFLEVEEPVKVEVEKIEESVEVEVEEEPVEVKEPFVAEVEQVEETVEAEVEKVEEPVEAETVIPTRLSRGRKVAVQEVSVVTTPVKRGRGREVVPEEPTENVSVEDEANISPVVNEVVESVVIETEILEKFEETTAPVRCGRSRPSKRGRGRRAAVNPVSEVVQEVKDDSEAKEAVEKDDSEPKEAVEKDDSEPKEAVEEELVETETSNQQEEIAEIENTKQAKDSIETVENGAIILPVEEPVEVITENIESYETESEILEKVEETTAPVKRGRGRPSKRGRGRRAAVNPVREVVQEEVINHIFKYGNRLKNNL